MNLKEIVGKRTMRSPRTYRLPDDLLRALKAAAKSHGLSENALVELILRNAVLEKKK